MSKYWVEHEKYGCPIGGPFDLWRQNYFIANGEPPEDTARMYPDISAETVTAVAVATVNGGVMLDDLLIRFGDRGPGDQLTMAHAYFGEWRKSAPFMPDSMQDIPRRWGGVEPEPLKDFLEDWRRVRPHGPVDDIREVPWPGVLDEECSKPYFQKLLDVGKTGREIYPAHDKVFEAFRLTSFEAAKVVIVGQDPYPNPDQATGLAFSVPPDLHPLPASLRNIREAMRDDGINPLENGDLTHWAKQGVLLLNTALTVPRGKPGAHVAAWRPFTRAVIGRLNSRAEPVLFVLWGAKAQKLTKLISAPPHQIIRAPHPAARGAAQAQFRKSHTFSQVNKALGDAAIEWASA